jgi:hypothetical protein
MKILRQLWRGLPGDRQADGEGAALVGAPAGGGETAMVRPHQVAGNGQANARVLHGNAHFVTRRPGAHRDSAAGRRLLQGVESRGGIC